MLEKLEPRFPVLDGAWIGEMPVEYLPWAAIFDHEGNRIFADSLKKGLKETLDGALKRAPHYITGGPYEELRELAAGIAADPLKAGRSMKKLRKLAGSGDEEGSSPAARKAREARILLTSLEAHFERRIAKADYFLPDNKVDAADIYKELADMFAGDPLGDRAAALLKEITADPNFDNERKAHEALQKARAAFRKLPPAGNYSYNLEYTETSDPKVLARRRQILKTYTAALRSIIEKYPRTYAAELAGDFISDIADLSAIKESR